MTDDKLELSRRKILVGAGTIGLASAGAGLGTSAFFSDQETFTNNSLVAGELDMKVSWEEHYSDWSEDEAEHAHMEDGELVVDDRQGFMDATLQERFPDKRTRRLLDDGTADPCEVLADVPDDLEKPVIDITDVKPGDFGEVTFDFALCDNPGYVWMNGGLLDEKENGLTEPEAEDTDEGPGVELADEIQVTIWYDDGDNVIEDPETIVTDREFDPPSSSAVAVSGDDRIIAQGSLRNILSQLATGNGIPLDGIPGSDPPGRDCFTDSPTIHYIGFKWELPVDHANEIQTDSVSFNLGFYTEQCRHNDGSGIGPEGQTTFTVRVENLGGTVNDSPNVLSPGAFAVHDYPGPIFEVGEPASAGLEDVAEDGMPGVLANELAAKTALTDSGAFGAAPIGPGGAYEFDVTGVPGDALSFATMFVQSNDLFFAPGPGGIDLFDTNGDPVSGDVTGQVALWDAGTEDDQEPGIGSNQAPRQSGPDTGPADSNSSTVQLVSNVNAEGYSYPADEDVIEVTITPQ